LIQIIVNLLLLQQLFVGLIIKQQQQERVEMCNIDKYNSYELFVCYELFAQISKSGIRRYQITKLKQMFF